MKKLAKILLLICLLLSVGACHNTKKTEITTCSSTLLPSENKVLIYNRGNEIVKVETYELLDEATLDLYYYLKPEHLKYEEDIISALVLYYFGFEYEQIKGFTVKWEIVAETSLYVIVTIDYKVISFDDLKYIGFTDLDNMEDAKNKSTFVVDMENHGFVCKNN